MRGGSEWIHMIRVWALCQMNARDKSVVFGKRSRHTRLNIQWGWMFGFSFWNLRSVSTVAGWITWQMKHIVQVMGAEKPADDQDKNKHIHAQTIKQANTSVYSGYNGTSRGNCFKKTLLSHKIESCRHEWVTRHENQMRISFHKTWRFLCGSSMPTESPCLLCINTDSMRSTFRL